MRLTQHEPSGEVHRVIGATVVRAGHTGEVMIELGSPDGGPFVHLTLATEEAQRLATALRSVGAGGGEEVLITEQG